MAEPPYGEIADLMKEGGVIPFLGAGINCGTRQPPDAKWDEKTTGFLPTGAELSGFLAEKSSFPSTERHDLDDLAKVASFYVETTERKRLKERLHKVFDRDFVPCEIHHYLAQIQTPLLIVTTNYDDLTERAFVAAGRPFDLVVHASDSQEIAGSVLWWKQGAAEPEPVLPSKLCIDLKKTSVIYKMHGTVDRRSTWDNYVITEEDYVDFLARMTGQTAVPAQFMKHFRTRHFLFLGYGLRDWNLRVVLRNLRAVVPTAADLDAADEEEESSGRSWAIQYRPSDLEVELWNARKVKIYDEDISEFVRRLREKSS